MELLNFNQLKQLAVADPGALDALLHQHIDLLISDASPELQPRLRGLQFQIDCQRQLAKNNLDSCIRISTMMHDSFYRMRCSLMAFSAGAPQEIARYDKENNVIAFVSRPHQLPR